MLACMRMVMATLTGVTCLRCFRIFLNFVFFLFINFFIMRKILSSPLLTLTMNWRQSFRRAQLLVHASVPKAFFFSNYRKTLGELTLQVRHLASVVQSVDGSISIG